MDGFKNTGYEQGVNSIYAERLTGIANTQIDKSWLHQLFYLQECHSLYNIAIYVFLTSKTIELSVLYTVVEFMTLCCTVNLTSDKLKCCHVAVLCFSVVGLGLKGKLKAAETEQTHDA